MGDNAKQPAQQKTPQTQQQPPAPQPTKLENKDASKLTGAGFVEHNPLSEVVISNDFNRVIIYSESFKAESTFTGGKKSVMTIKNNREVSISVEPETES